MKIRKLAKEEHGMTRPLWEEIFTEDGKGFLDYYYQVKTADNEIYVVEEEDGGLSAMLQLNPYEVRFMDRVCSLHYIIAVATKKEYRGRGYMTRLLETSSRDMYQAGEPFTFLMPAAEGIYYPHGFRCVYGQSQIDGEIQEKEEQRPEVCCQVRQAEERDCGRIAAFAEKVLGRMSLIRTVRREKYYQTLLREQQSEGGGILVTERAGLLTGCVIYSSYDGKTELREPLFDELEDWKTVLSYLRNKPEKKMHIAGIRSEEEEHAAKEMLEHPSGKEEPMIMARIVHLRYFLESFTAKEAFRIYLHVEDRLIPENDGDWEIVGKSGEHLTARKLEGASEQAEPVSVGDLAIGLFGYDADREKQQDACQKTGTLMRELMEKTCLAPPVFLNEIV